MSVATPTSTAEQVYEMAKQLAPAERLRLVERIAHDLAPVPDTRARRSMSGILFDTNVVSYWHAGDRRFKAPLYRLLTELRRERTAFYISAITLQELGHWAIVANSWPALSQFISATRLVELRCTVAQSQCCVARIQLH